MANTILAGYEMPIGEKLLVIFDHLGPKSYSNVSTSSGTGDVVNASDFNRGGFDDVIADGISASGNYFVLAYRAKSGSGNAIPSFVLRWFSYPAAATTGAVGAEVTNGTDLSAESVRITAVMV